MGHDIDFGYKVQSDDLQQRWFGFASVEMSDSVKTEEELQIYWVSSSPTQITPTIIEELLHD